MVLPRFSKAGLRFFLWALALATLGGGSFLGIAGLLALVRGSSFSSSDNLFLSLICAAIAWLFVAVFHFGKETINLPLHQPATFLANARRVLVEMGYEVGPQTGDSLGTRHAFQFILLARGIQIQCTDRLASITGPKMWVDVLRRRLRVQNFLGAQHSPHDGGTGLLLKRVQIRMRVPPEILEEVSRHIVPLLAQEAEVICEVNLLAQSHAGIRESTVEQHVRAWLHEQGITAEIHKDLVMMSEPPSTILLPGSGERQAVVCKIS